MGGLNWLGAAYTCLCSVLLYWMGGLFNLVFSSLTRQLAQDDLCSVELQDGWPRLAVFSSIAGRLAYDLCE